MVPKGSGRDLSSCMCQSNSWEIKVRGLNFLPCLILQTSMTLVLKLHYSHRQQNLYKDFWISLLES